VRFSTAQNCSIVRNSVNSSFGGGAEYATIQNCIVYLNDGGNCFGGGVEYSCTTPDPGGTGNITNDPQFVDLSTTNLRLKSTSPCINTGTNMAWMAGAVDLNGLPRIINGTVDMGTYEWPHMMINGIRPPLTPSDGPVMTWASFTGAQYAVYGSTNLLHGYDIQLLAGIPAYPPENAFTDTVSAVELRGYVVEYTP
jgi:hypothetical protein